MKMGIGIGWPNASASASPNVYLIRLWGCTGSTAPSTTYSLDSEFKPGIYLFSDIELTTPFTGIGGEFEGGNQYTITDGLVTNEFFICV